MIALAIIASGQCPDPKMVDPIVLKGRVPVARQSGGLGYLWGRDDNALKRGIP